MKAVLEELVDAQLEKLAILHVLRVNARSLIHLDRQFRIQFPQ